MSRLAVGLVGCGGMGRRHLRAYQALSHAGAGRFELGAVCDLRRQAAEEAADLVEELFGNRPQVFSDPQDLVDSGAVDALDVTTDPSVHHLVAVPALEAGLHVICEKPLGVTVAACRTMLAAAARSGAVLATAENYRRDGPNRLARAVLDHGLLGEVHLMVETNIGGDSAVVISPWRHRRESGSLALDMGVHYTDLFAYYLGELEEVCGSVFVAEPVRTLPGKMRLPAGIEEVAPGTMSATGEDSIVALFRTASGTLVQLAYVPSGPGRHFVERSVHGRAGSMTVPMDRTGGAVVVTLGERVLSGAALRHELGGFELVGIAADLFGTQGTEYDLGFAEVDAATIAIELDDFAGAVLEGRPPEVDGRAGLLAVAGVWAVAESQLNGRAVRIADVAEGLLRAAQHDVDAALGLLAVAAAPA